MPAATPPTRTSIAKAIVQRLGSTEQISNIDSDTGTTAGRIRVHWDAARRLLLQRHPWNFAIARQLLNASPDAPAFGYARKFQLPQGCIRWLPPGPGDDDFFRGEVEGRYILSDEAAPLKVRFVSDHDTVSEWSPGFIEALTLCICAWIADGVTQGEGITQRMIELADRALMVGKRLDGLETGSRRPSTVASRSAWLRGRGRPWGWRG